MRRAIILHHHIFKNAGSSIDHILEANFGARWLRCEYPPGVNDSGLEAEQLMNQTPHAAAYSSHTWRGRLPRPENADVISLVMLRDPISRVKSAYEFERRQIRDAPGPNLAKAHDFAGYVRKRLERPGDRQCRNLQTRCLAVLSPGPEPELERAKRALDQFTLTGFVEAFDDVVACLAERVRPHYPEFAPVEAWSNARVGDHPEASPELLELLEAHHRDDHALIAYAKEKTGFKTR